MPAPIDKRLVRVGYYDGQLLAARDLRDDAQVEADLRALHVRAVHGVWGVALGFVVTADGDSAVRVTPGVAYDSAGRELVLASPLRLTLPMIPEGIGASEHYFDLLVYRDRGNSVPAARGVVAACPGHMAGRGADEPALRWAYAGTGPAFSSELPLAEDVRLGEEIPLARVCIRADGRIAGAVDLVWRRVARVLARPYLASGHVEQGSLPIQGSPSDWSVHIDTASGDFRDSAPLYFATLADNPWLSPDSEFAELLKGLTSDTRRGLIGPILNVDESSQHRTGFHLRVLTAIPRDADPIELAAAVQATGMRLPVAIHWLGIESSH